MESPDTVHGRLLEAVHISGYTFERACGELEWLLDHNRWKSVGKGYQDINAFLATLDFSEFRIALDQRRKLARRLEMLQAQNTATGRLLGVDESTIREDLGKKKRSGNPEVTALPGPQNLPVMEVHSGNPDWFQVDADPSREAKRIARNQEREFE